MRRAAGYGGAECFGNRVGRPAWHDQIPNGRLLAGFLRVCFGEAQLRPVSFSVFLPIRRAGEERAAGELAQASVAWRR